MMRAVIVPAAFLVLGLVVSATGQATEKKQRQGHGDTAVTTPADTSAPKQAATKSSASSNAMKKMSDTDNAIIQNQK